MYYTNKLIKSIKCSPGCFFRVLWKIAKTFSGYYQTHEVRKCRGTDFPDKTFYIIGMDEGWCGLFAIITHQLTHIAYAVEQGYIPVVDLQNYFNQYLSDKALFKENAWEYYFRQPMGYSLRDIKKAKHIIAGVNSGNLPVEKYRLGYKDCYNAQTISYYRKIAGDYLRFNGQTEKYLMATYNEVLKDKGKVLGVLCRGTDFTSLKPHGHPVQPDAGQVIEKAEQVMKAHQCTHLYLATEDAAIFTLFAHHFGEKLIAQNSHRWRAEDLKPGRSNATIYDDAGKDRRYQGGLEYLSEIYLLSKCHCFIGGATRGTIGALLMTGGYEYQYIFDLGVYN
jgi:hypothetical protein